MAMPAARVTCDFNIIIGSKNLRYRLVLRYTPRSYKVAVGCACEFSFFSNCNKNLRYRLVCCDPYREYNLKEHRVREDISYIRCKLFD